jgi:hypothetical protein
MEEALLAMRHRLAEVEVTELAVAAAGTRRSLAAGRRVLVVGVGIQRAYRRLLSARKDLVPV